MSEAINFNWTDDKFALGNTRLVNHKTYYFMSIAYGYNRAVKDHNLRVDIEVPNKNAPSMSMALEQYIKEANKRRR